MRGVHAWAAPATRRTVRITWEAGLLALVGLGTWLTATNRVQVDWAPVDAALIDDRWALLPVCGAIVVTLVRLWSPAIALLAAAVLFGWWPATAIAVAVAAFAAAASGGALRRVVLLGAAAVSGFAAGLLTNRFLLYPGLPVLMVVELHVATAVVCLALPAGARTLLGKVDRVLRALRERTRYLEEVSRLAHSAARIQERSRIAQEMHDQLGHRLSLITLYAGGLELSSAMNASGGAEEATLIRGTAQTAMRELRAILGVLSSTDPDDAGPRPEPGLRCDVARLVHQSQAAGVEVELTWRGTDLDDVAVPVRRAVHRIVREGLTNVHRHAAGAACAVVVEHAPDAVRVEVSNGRSAAPTAGPRQVPPGTGQGLAGAQERVRLLGGDFAAGPTPDGGFHLSAGLPTPTPTGIDGASGRAEAAARGGPPAVVPYTAGKQASSVDRWLRYGASAVLVGGLVGVAAFVVEVLTYMPWYSAEYQAVPTESPTATEVRIGMTRAEAVAILGEGDVLARLAARSIESRPPAGSACLYNAASTGGLATIYRYCFRDDRLVRMDSFDVDGLTGAVSP